MKPIDTTILTWAINILIYGVGVWIIRHYVFDTEGRMKDEIRRVEARMQTAICREIAAIQSHCNVVHHNVEATQVHTETEIKGLWDVITTHGHKALDENGGKVTR